MLETRQLISIPDRSSAPKSSIGSALIASRASDSPHGLSIISFSRSVRVLVTS